MTLEVGLKTGAPFVYLDEWCPSVDWVKMHDECAAGLAKSEWTKTVVSAGVHPEWAHLEMATYYRNMNKLSAAQALLFEALSSKEAKIKFLAAVTDTVHPFWLCFLRTNKIIEKTGIMNKATAADCSDTENAANFPLLMEFIDRLPFREIGRVVLFMTEPNNSTVPHFDAASLMQRTMKTNDQFIWFQTRPGKRLFVMDKTKMRHYPDPSKHFLWFNEMDYHGTEPFEKFSFSIRVEGVFDERVG